MTQEFKALKFRIANEDQSKRLQEVLFKLGYSWFGDMTVKNVKYERIDTWQDMSITHCDDMDYRASNNAVEQDTEEFIKMHTKGVKTPHKFSALIKQWADGATIQYWNGDHWKDTHNNSPKWYELENYRVKPEPVEVWQWAFGYGTSEYSSEVTSSFYASEEEAYDSFLCKPTWLVKLEPTKKIVEQ